MSLHSILWVISIVLIILKVAGLISISWFTVFLPILIPIIISGIFLVCLALLTKKDKQ